MFLFVIISISAVDVYIYCSRAVYRRFAKGGLTWSMSKSEAVRSCRAAAGGWVQEGDVPPPAQNFYLSKGLSALAHGSTSDPDPIYINPVRTRIHFEPIAIHLIHIRRWIRSGFDPD